MRYEWGVESLLPLKNNKTERWNRTTLTDIKNVLLARVSDRKGTAGWGNSFVSYLAAFLDWYSVEARRPLILVIPSEFAEQENARFFAKVKVNDF